MKASSTSSNFCLMLNDHASYNKLYRADLMAQLEEEGTVIKSLGIFDGYGKFIAGLLKFVFGRFGGVILSSNLRANLVAMLLFWCRGMAILNGLGRYRANPAARRLVGNLMRLNWRKHFAIQCYSDYRYFRRYYGHSRLFWVPGSGGSQRKVGTEAKICIVQRDSKIECVRESVLDFCQHTGTSQLVVVGCKNNDLVASVLAGIEVESMGFVDQDDIFLPCDTFLQPTGYGEGFPHTLADALVTGLKIHIDRLNYIQFGLYKLDIGAVSAGGRWRTVQPYGGDSMPVSCSTVNKQYYDIFRQILSA